MDKDLDARLTTIENQLSRIERMVTKRFVNSGDANGHREWLEDQLSCLKPIELKKAQPK